MLEYNILEEDIDYFKPVRKIADRIVQPNLSAWTDDELLEVPAHLIANAYRTAALDGRTLIIADPVAMSDACVRIPDEESTIFDYNPHLDWNTYQEVELGEEGNTPVNRELANKAIPYRVMEPSLPDKTRITPSDASVTDSSVSPVEQCIVRGYCAIQAVQKSGSDARELANILNKAWGGYKIFSAMLHLDILGDIGFQRYIARASKRRFQMYRNIGWVSIVSAGASQAQNANYGGNAVINWQRRTELAMAYVHMAMMFEGAALIPYSKFSISVRVPAYSVQYATWSDCSLICDATKMRDQNIPAAFTKLADDIIRVGMMEFFTRLVAGARRYNLEGQPDAVVQERVDRYEKLVFVEPLVVKDSKRDEKLKLELSFGRSVEPVRHYPVQFKSLDPATAVIECLSSGVRDNSTVTMEASNLVTALQVVVQNGYRFSNKGDLTKYVGELINRYRNLLTPVARYVDTSAGRRLREKLMLLANYNIPHDLIIEKDLELTLANITAHDLVRNRESKSSKTLMFWANSLKESLSNGVRTKKSVLYKDKHGLDVAVAMDMSAAMRTVYNARYRARGNMYRKFSDLAKSKQEKQEFMFWSRHWYMMADAANSFYIKVEKNDAKLELNMSNVKRTIRVAIGYIANFFDADELLVKPFKVDDLPMEADKWLATLQLDLPKKSEMAKLFTYTKTKIESIWKEHIVDYEQVKMPSAPKLEEKTSKVTIDSSMFTLKPYSRDTLDEAVSYLLTVGGYTEILEPDEVDEIQDKVIGVLSKDKARAVYWVEAAKNVKEESVAKDKIEKILAQIEDDVIEDNQELA